MSPLEIRILGYAVLLGLFAWGVHTLDAHHYERLAQADKLAQASAYEVQQAHTIADLKAQQAATQVAEKQYETLKATSDVLAQHLSDSLSNYTALRRGLLSTTPPTATGSDAARAGAERDSQLAKLFGLTAEACLGDAAALTGLQTWATSSTSH